ncbi:MAG: carbohydrate kinase family protein [Clostridia bacterium]|nr:carbohydrate kinase family protein [Clostridia bacterium]
MKKIAIAGSILLDVVKTVDAWPARGMLVNILKTERAVGGCVCNTGIDLKRLGGDGIDVEAYGRIGSDAHGDFVLERMAAEGIDVRGVVRDRAAETSFTDVMTEVETGERTFFNLRGASAAFGGDDVDPAMLDCDLFHLGYLLLLDRLDAPDAQFGTAAARLLRDVQSRGIKTSIDVVSEQSDRFQKVIAPALPYCDYVVINEVEGSRLSGIPVVDRTGRLSVENLERICRKLLSLGIRTCVTIHCPQLSCALTAAGAFTVVPSLKLPPDYIRGAVGAGDAFCAGMLYAFVHGMPEEEGMRLASCAAACNLSAADSVGGARSLAQTWALEKQFIRRTLS